MSDLLILALTVFAPIFILGIFGFWFTACHFHPFMREIGADPRNRGASRRVLFGGVVNGSPEQVVRLQKIRAIYVGSIFLPTAFLIGLGAVVFLSVVLFFNFLMARPFDVVEANT